MCFSSVAENEQHRSSNFFLPYSDAAYEVAQQDTTTSVYIISNSFYHPSIKLSDQNTIKPYDGFLFQYMYRAYFSIFTRPLTKQMHNYFTNYHTATYFDTIVSSSGSL